MTISTVLRCPVCKQLRRYFYFSLSEQAKLKPVVCNTCFDSVSVPLFTITGIGG